MFLNLLSLFVLHIKCNELEFETEKRQATLARYKRPREKLFWLLFYDLYRFLRFSSLIFVISFLKFIMLCMTTVLSNEIPFFKFVKFVTIKYIMRL